jgi:hypothetical protein
LHGQAGPCGRVFDLGQHVGQGQELLFRAHRAERFQGKPKFFEHLDGPFRALFGLEQGFGHAAEPDFKRFEVGPGSLGGESETR